MQLTLSKLTAKKTNISSPAIAKLPCSRSNYNRKTEHITPELKSQYWLKIEERIHTKYSSLHTILSIPHNPNASENLSILNLLAPLVLPIILVHPIINYLSIIFQSSPPIHTSSLKISNRSYNRVASILRNNLPKSMRTFSNTSLILQPLANVPLYHSHFLRFNFVHISKHTFSASRTHRNLLSSSD